jgi:hypothetical protein
VRVAREDLVAQESHRVGDRLVELRERLVAIGLGLRPRRLGLLDPQEHVANQLEGRRREMQDQGFRRGVVPASGPDSVGPNRP